MDYVLLISVIVFLIGLGVGFVIKKYNVEKELEEAKKEAEKIIKNAEKEAKAKHKEYLIQAKDEIFQQKRELEKEVREREKNLKKQEIRLHEKEERLEAKQEKLAKKEAELVEIEKNLSKLEQDILKRKEEIDSIVQKQQRKLEEISGLTKEEAREKLLEEIKSSTKHEAARMIRQIEAEAKEIADKKAQEILATAIQKYAGEYVIDNTVTVVELPNEEMKGRIIGREGRNIRAFEAATGVDLIIDDTPETVVLSAFNPLRREKAKIVLERLITDGRIHPARIEDIVQKVDREMEVRLREIGEQATFDVGVHGIHPELIRLLGHLYYRTSFTQNVLSHSLEVAFLCGIMAAELKLDVKMAKRAGLLHDIGKAVDHEIEGPHALIGAELAKKYGESDEVVHAIAAHHEDIQPETVLAVLVQAADSLSGARPGARKELLEHYVKRLEELENVALSFEGVIKAYAIQAGRELRVMVDCETVDENETYLLCKEIAKKIEEQLTYPGQIKVTCIREKRAVEYAR
ncbi:ribonuclease Y [Desulfothermus naphthae]